MIYLEYYHWMANDWFITHQSLHKNKREKNHQSGEGNHSIKTKEKKTTRVERGMD